MLTNYIRVIDQIYLAYEVNNTVFTFVNSDTVKSGCVAAIHRLIMSNPEHFNTLKIIEDSIESYFKSDSKIIKFELPTLLDDKEKWLHVTIEKNEMHKVVWSDISELKLKIIELEQVNNHLEAKVDKMSRVLSGRSTIWYSDLEAYPNGEEFISDETMNNLFGLKLNDRGHYLFDALLDTFADDEEGSILKEAFLVSVKHLISGEKKAYRDIVTKHVNPFTETFVYIKSNIFAHEHYDDGRGKFITGYSKNVTEQTAKSKADILKEQYANTLIRADKLAIKSGKVMVWFQDNTTFDMFKYFYGNDLFVSKLGLESIGNGLITRSSYHETLYTEDAEGKKLVDEYLELVRQIASGDIEGFEGVIVKHKNIKTGELIYCEHASEVEERYENGSIKIDGGFIIDVTERVKQEKAIEYIANHDLLTHLYNRNFVDTYLKSNQIPENYMLVLADLDGLKLINDAFGHLEGDKAIRTVASTLRKFYPNGVISRMGGDEFLIISKDLDDQRHEEIFKHIRTHLKGMTKNNSFEVSLSLGYSLVEQNINMFDDAFKIAENLMYRRKLMERNSRKSKTLETILDTLNARSIETHEHSQRMADLAIETLRNLGHTKLSEAEDIQLLARVHDIGKVVIPDSILKKPDRLTKEEFEIIKTHTEAGYKIIKNIIDSDKIAEGVYYHHERYDGKGYPLGLKGEEIPLYARIITVCDVFDVMVSGRIYQKPKSAQAAVDELIKYSGTQFDEKVVKAFLIALKIA